MLESPSFQMNLSVISGFQTLFNAAAELPEVRELSAAMARSGEAREAVQNRIRELSNLNIDPRYVNPKDYVLAIYLWLTYFVASEQSTMAAGYVDGAPQCWNAKKLARWLLTPRTLDSGNQLSTDESSNTQIDVGTTPGALMLQMKNDPERTQRRFDSFVIASEPSSVGTIISHGDVQ